MNAHRWPSVFSRVLVLDLVRRHALIALSQRDDRTWRRAVDILDREAKRIERERMSSSTTLAGAL
ncbi:MAG TPA: hypothetical protein VFP15_13490 [Gemmatimonadaceae bacterium]|nr:hypothetical protein [Gemmatimonadaceae bacterium]